MLPIIRKALMALRGGVIRIKPRQPEKGRVLLSYITQPFIDPAALDSHTNRWECREIARIFAEKGYAVDVIDWDNASIKSRDYDFLIDVRPDMENIAGKVGADCFKVFHATGTYWKFQNDAELARIKDIEKRRGAILAPRRTQKSGRSAEVADIITMLGNDFTASTYAFAGKEIVRIPISTTRLFPSPAGKDYEKARKGFIWLGGAGMAHKGLDLVLEAFAAMPELDLSVFGKGDADFIEAYKKELFETPNIRYFGHVDIGGPRFKEAALRSASLVFPSCSEGGAGSVVESMHAGLIPIVSRESSITVDGFGVVLRENTIDEIKKEARAMAALPADRLASMAQSAWEHARADHTRESFSNAFRAFVERIEKERYHRKTDEV